MPVLTIPTLRRGASARTELDVPPALPAAPIAPTLPQRRSPKWIALGVLLICLGGLLSYVVYARMATETQVLVASKTIYRGQVIAPGDLTTAPLRRGTLPDVVPAAELTTLVGRRAALDLAAGNVVPRAAIASAPFPAPGRALVGLKLAHGRLPNTDLAPAAPIRLVALAPGDRAAADALTGGIYAARVVGQTAAPDGVSVLLDVDVDQRVAAAVAALAAQERLAVVRDPAR